MALGSTQPIVKMNTRNIPGGKGGRCVRLTTLPPSRAEYHGNLGAETSWKPLGHTGPVTGLLYLWSLQLRRSEILGSGRSRSQWSCGLQLGSTAPRFLELRVRIRPVAWMSVCCVLSGGVLCYGLITRPDESHRLWCVWVWSWGLDNEKALAQWGGGRCPYKNNRITFIIIFCHVVVYVWYTFALSLSL